MGPGAVCDFILHNTLSRIPNSLPRDPSATSRAGYFSSVYWAISM